MGIKLSKVLGLGNTGLARHIKGVLFTNGYQALTSTEPAFSARYSTYTTMVILLQQRNHYAITGRASTGQTFDRLSVQELEAHHPYQWTLLVLGWAWIKGEPIPFPGVVQPPLLTPISFMEIGGVHGNPYREWPGDIRVPPESNIDFSYLDPKDMYTTPTRFGGYCHHAAITFPTWHRPYVMLIEQAIGEYAENVAQQIENSHPGETKLWIEAAKQLRFPYWDWADPQVDKEGLPSLFYSDELSVMGTGKTRITVPNPLSYYKLPYIPEDFQNQTRNGLTSWFTQWERTYRYAENSPNPPGNDITALQTNLKKQAGDIRRKVGMLFCYPEGGSGPVIYDEFSNTRNQSRPEGDPSNFGSLEAVHNTMHGVLGGNGNMGWPDYAGFDPIFYFHHCNVDRLFALWEWCFPEYWMENGYNLDGTDYSWTIEKGAYADAYSQKLEEDGNFGHLVPFRHPDGVYWTNNESRLLHSKAYPKYYSYKEFLGVNVNKAAASPKEKQEARARIAKYYGIDIDAELDAIHKPSWTHITIPGVGEAELPSNFQGIKNFRLFTILAVLPEHAFNGPYNLEIYYKDELAGTVNVFARQDNSPCKNCVLRREAGSSVRGVINIPSRIINDIIVHSGVDPSKNTPAITVGLITKALTGKLTDGSGKAFATAQGGDGVPAVPKAQSIPRSSYPNEVSLLSAAVAESVDDQNQAKYFFDWKQEANLFPSGWKVAA